MLPRHFQAEKLTRVDQIPNFEYKYSVQVPEIIPLSTISRLHSFLQHLQWLHASQNTLKSINIGNFHHPLNQARHSHRPHRPNHYTTPHLQKHSMCRSYPQHLLLLQTCIISRQNHKQASKATTLL